MVQDIPNVSGIYCAYNCVFIQESYTVSIKQLLYIEESADVNQQILKHLDSGTWSHMVIPGEDLCFSVAPFDSDLSLEDQERIAHAMVFKYQPICNDGPRKNTSPNVRTQIKSDGDIAYLNSSITSPFLM